MPRFPNPFYFLLPFNPFAIPIFIFLWIFLINIFLFLLVIILSRFVYPFAAPDSFLFHFVEYLGAPFLSHFLLVCLLFFSNSFYCHPQVVTLIFLYLYSGCYWFLPTFSRFLCICFFFFPFPSFSFLFFSPLFFCAPFSFLFSLFFLFGAPPFLAPLLGPRGATAPYAPQDTPLSYKKVWNFKT